MQLIDTHCHLDFSDFDADRDIVIKRAISNGISLMIDVGASLDSSQKAVALAKNYASIFAAVGIHPHEADRVKDKDFSLIEELAQEKRVVAIGETGLDYYRNLSSHARQQEVFNRFISIAQKSSLPLIIHCREAREDTLSILKKNNTRLKVLMHCFSADMDFLKSCLDLDFFISVTCNLTYNKAIGLKEVVRFVPLERLFLETDSPFLSPEGFRGKRNEPMHIKLLADEVSKIKGIDIEEVARVTTQNAKSFFSLA